MVLDRLRALALVRERRADLAVQLGDVLEVTLARCGTRGPLPHRDRGVDATESQRDVALLLADARLLGVIAGAQRDGRLVVGERLLVGVQGARRIAGGLEELERLPRSGVSSSGSRRTSSPSVAARP